MRQRIWSARKYKGTSGSAAHVLFDLRSSAALGEVRLRCGSPYFDASDLWTRGSEGECGREDRAMEAMRE